MRESSFGPRPKIQDSLACTVSIHILRWGSFNIQYDETYTTLFATLTFPCISEVIDLSRSKTNPACKWRHTKSQSFTEMKWKSMHLTSQWIEISRTKSIQRFFFRVGKCNFHLKLSFQSNEWNQISLKERMINSTKRWNTLSYSKIIPVMKWKCFW